MDLGNIPLFKAMMSRMSWLNERQQVLAQNVANSDTPHYRPLDLVEQKFPLGAPGPAGVQLARTNPGHLSGFTDTGEFPNNPNQYQVRPAGNAVNVEDEMIKVAANQMDYQAATQLYTRSLGLWRTAIGK